jgi:hypothetical protein
MLSSMRWYQNARASAFSSVGSARVVAGAGSPSTPA